jgi:peptidoglycan-N-acetylglucosamine deacetylase
VRQFFEPAGRFPGLSVTTLERIAEHTNATVNGVHTHARIDVPTYPGPGARSCRAGWRNRRSVGGAQFTSHG